MPLPPSRRRLLPGEIHLVETVFLLGSQFALEIRQRNLDGKFGAPGRVEPRFDGFQASERGFRN